MYLHLSCLYVLPAGAVFPMEEESQVLNNYINGRLKLMYVFMCHAVYDLYLYVLSAVFFPFKVERSLVFNKRGTYVMFHILSAAIILRCVEKGRKGLDF